MSRAIFLSHDANDRPVVSVVPYSGGLRELYAAMNCDLVEVVANGKYAGVNVTLLADEEGLLKSNYLNFAANDFAAELTKHPSYSLRPSLVGHAAVVVDTGEDWRGFTDAELAKVVAQLHNGGYTLDIAA